MDLVGGVASISQLAHYSASATSHLINLYKATQNGATFCREQNYGIRLLLQLVHRVCKTEAADLESILPLLIAITDLASSLLNLLGPRGTLHNRWLWVCKSAEIEKSFRSLSEKTSLLQLYVTERTFSLLSKMDKTTNPSDGAARGGQTSTVFTVRTSFSYFSFPSLSYQDSLTILGLRGTTGDYVVSLRQPDCHIFRLA